MKTSKRQLTEAQSRYRNKLPDEVKVIRGLLSGAKSRAQKLGLPCTITKDDIVVP